MNEITVNEILSKSDGSKRRVKIVATIGPASYQYDTLKRLILAGANVFRLNFSHGTHEQHSEILTNVRKAAKELGVYVAVLQDLSGPKVRITKVDTSSDLLEDGATTILKASSGEISTSSLIAVETVDPVAFLKVGQQVLLADGAFTLEAIKILKDSVECRIIKGGHLRSNIGIAFPDSVVDLPATTEKDIRDLEWGIKNEIDYVALSFVGVASDISAVTKVVAKAKGNCKIIAKIERKVALQNLDQILEVADGVMVARGDLGLEIELEKLPVIQKLIIERANIQGLPVIVATQMLSSMVNNPRPTRAEVADVSLAVLNGADAVMLSEETAIGRFPVEAVTYLHKIGIEAERRFQFSEYKWKLKHSEPHSVPEAVTFAASGAADKIRAAAIIACTETGNSARLAAKYRPEQPLYGASASESTLRRMCLNWGVIPISCASSATHSDELQTALREVQLRENLPNGAWAIITGGLAVRTPGATNVLEIRQMNFK